VQAGKIKNMAVHTYKEYAISCDHCNEWWNYSNSGDKESTVKDQLQESGWKRKKGKIICTECQIRQGILKVSDIPDGDQN